MSIDSTTLPDLFPVPSSPPSHLIPRVWPGVNPKSIATLREVLQDNHKRWHIFFNDQGFHNHSSHRSIAIWALGAHADVIKSSYDHDTLSQRPAFDSPNAIDATNYKNHLGDRRYYGAYLAFFTSQIGEKGVAPVVEQFIFSKDANFVPADTSEKKLPDIFNRFLGGLLHPMIHAGYGLEFCLPGMVAEGLAEAAVHPDGASSLVPESLFDFSKGSQGLGDAVSRLKSIVISDDSTPKKAGVHIFTVLARVLKDAELGDMVNEDGVGIYSTAMKKYGHILLEYMKDWHVDTSNPHDVERKLEELCWMNVLIYGVGGWKKGQQHYNADFFNMHLVTSSIFLSSYITYLTPSSQETLLRGFLLTSLTWWVSRGRPGFDIQGFFEATDPHPLPSGKLPAPHKDTFPSADSPIAVTPNAWFPIIETSVVHPDEHLPKLQRTLVHFDALYGAREQGRPDFTGTELPFADLVDGTLFLRVAGLTAKRIGRVREGEDHIFWDRVGFYKS